jgi:hypothetical protein
MGEERRKSPRVVVDVPARVTVEGETIEGRIRDICRDAALVLAARTWPLGTRVAVMTTLPRVVGPVSFSGPVVRLAEPVDGLCGMAVLFESVDPQTLLRIELFVADPA